MLPETPWLMLPAMLLLGFPLDALLRGEVRFGQVDQMLQRGRKRRLGAALLLPAVAGMLVGRQLMMPGR